MALRYLGHAGIPVPKVFLASSAVLVQERIHGITIANIIDRYEELKDSGVLGDDD